MVYHNKCLVYLTKMRYPNKKAHSIQITRTITALSPYIPILLIVKHLNCDPAELTEIIKNFYGCNINGNLKIISIKKKYYNYFCFPYIIKIIRSQIGNYDYVFYTRTYDIADKLLFYRWLHRKKIMFESHKKAAIYKEDPVQNSPYHNIRLKMENNNQKLNFLRSIYERVDTLFFLHKHSEHIAKKLFNIKDPDFLWYGVQNKNFPCFNYRTKKIVYCGNITEKKLFDLLINAIQKISINCKVDIFGGSSEDISKRIRQLTDLGLNNKFDFKGRVSPNELKRQLQNYRFGISLLEGMKVIDYLENGVIPIIPRIPSFLDIFNESNAIFFRPDSAKSLSKVIQRSLSTNYDNNNLRPIIDRYSLDNRAIKILQHMY